jgi:hypothetical protein
MNKDWPVVTSRTCVADVRSSRFPPADVQVINDTDLQLPRLPLLRQCLAARCASSDNSRVDGDTKIVGDEVSLLQPTAYQYVKLGSNLEFLRGISTASVMQTASLAGAANLVNNMSPRRYSVVNVVNALKSLLVQLNEMGLPQSLKVAEPLRPMLAQMEVYLSAQPNPHNATVTDPFADRLVAIAVQVAISVRTELGMRRDER